MHATRLIALFLLILTSRAEAAVPPYDMLILLDESSLANPESRSIVKASLAGLSDKPVAGSRVGVYVYGEKSYESLPLSEISAPIVERLHEPSSRDAGDAAVNNTASALEKALYKLRENATEGVRRIVLILGDGVINTGDPLEDRQLSQWLLDDLSKVAREEGITIHWLAFTDRADYRVIQTLTSKTLGDYYRAFTPQQAAAAVDAVLTADASAARNVMTAVHAAQSDAAGQTESDRASVLQDSDPVYLSAAIATLALLGLGAVIVLRRRAGRSDDGRSLADQQEKRALLRDLAGFTAMSEYDITDKKTYIGRLPREVTERSTVIVIRDDTVGREHAVIQFEDNAYWISDSGSVNGTYINDTRIQEKQRLLDGDRIRFARFEFEVTLPFGESTAVGKVADGVRTQRPAYPVSVDDEEDRTLYRSR